MSTDLSRLFALIPAAGHSRRMGRPKLTLPMGDTTVIGQVLSALHHPGIIARCVVARRDDATLRSIAEAAEGWCVAPAFDPLDMRQSVSFGLSEIKKKYSPNEMDGWLVVPADSVALRLEDVSKLIEAWQQSTSSIMVPRYGHQWGHPTIFRWHLAAEVDRMPAEQGLNWLVHRYPEQGQEILFDSARVITDLDTPGDYQRLRSGTPDQKSQS